MAPISNTSASPEDPKPLDDGLVLSDYLGRITQELDDLEITRPVSAGSSLF
jgi:hypothetical protein